MQTLTLEQLRQRVIDATQLDVSGESRHTPTKVDALINEALYAYHSCLVDANPAYREKRATLTTSSSTTDDDGWPANEAVSLPADFQALKSVVLVTGDIREYLNQAGEAEQHLLATTGEPRAYRLSQDNDEAWVLRVFPPSDAAHTLVITYTSKPAELTHAGAEASLYEGTADYVVCDVVMRLLEDDGMQESGKYQAAARRHQAALERLERYVPRTDRSGPSRVVNTRFFR